MTEANIPQIFSSPIVPTEMSNRFQALEDDPEKIIRFTPLDYGGLEWEMKRHREAKRIQDRLRKEFEIHIINVDLVVGYNREEGKVLVL